MATKIWVGNAQGIAQQHQIDITAFDASTVYSLTIGDASIQKTKVVAVSGEVDDGATAAALANAINSSPHGEWQGVSAAATGPQVIITSNTPGIPHTITDSTSGGSGALTVAELTANKGPYDWDDNDNWDDAGPGTPGTKPENGDTIIVSDAQGGPQINIDDNSLAPANFSVRRDFKVPNRIGWPYTNKSGTPYNEYRFRPLRINFSTVDIGLGDANSQMSQVINLLAAVGPTEFNVHSSGTRLDAEVPPVNLQSLGSGNILRVFDGDVGSAFWGDEAAVWQTIENHGNLHLSQQTTYETGASLTNTGFVRLQKAEGDVALLITHRAGTLVVGGGNVVGNEFTQLCVVEQGATLRMEVAAYFVNLELYGVLDLTGLNKPVVVSGSLLLGPNARVIPDRRMLSVTGTTSWV